jgi:hypothetical protein
MRAVRGAARFVNLAGAKLAGELPPSIGSPQKMEYVVIR